MNFKIIKTLLILAVGIVIGTLLPRLLEKNEATQEEMNTFSETKEVSRASDSKEIDELTSEEVVIPFVKQNGTLPSYYLTKSEAKKKGWIPSQGNLCEVLPGQAIGGDRFSNREGKLPKGEQYFEADVNYNCGNRGADRIVFTKKGEVWLTHNHYKSFQKQ